MPKWLTTLLVRLDIFLHPIMISPDTTPPQPDLPPVYVPKTKPTLVSQDSPVVRFVKCIAAYEGGPGDLNHRNSNPTNIRCGVVMNHLAIAKDHLDFCIFPSWDVGMAAGIEQITNACTGKSKVYNPEMTILEFISKRSPSGDNNDPLLYAQWIGAHMNLPISTKIKTLVEIV